jgi:hypothetical protein
MTRAAFRDLSNTPQRLNVRQQHAAQKPGSGLQPQKQAPQQAAGRWCNALANPSPVFGSSVGSVQLQPSAGSSQGQISRLQLEPNAQHQQNAKDPLSLLAPAPRTSTSPYPNDLQQQQQQFNGALVRDFRRASGVDAPNLRPPNLRSPPSQPNRWTQPIQRWSRAYASSTVSCPTSPPCRGASTDLLPPARPRGLRCPTHRPMLAQQTPTRQRWMSPLMCRGSS